MEDKKKEKGEVSRRDFLVGAGAVVVGGAIGAGITYPLVSGGDGEVSTVTKTVSVPTTVTKTVGDGATATVTDTVTTTVGGDGATVTKTVTTTAPGDGVAWPYLEPEETCYKLQLTDQAVDYKNGKIVRIRPYYYNEKYPDLKPWSITARGKTFTIPMKTPVATYNIAYKRRVYSPNRILYPLKRVDWEPGGDPAKINAQNRGISKYKRISWDEATTIVASEFKRIADKYGPSALYVDGSPHGEDKNLHGYHGCPGAVTQLWCLAEYGKMYTKGISSPSSWEGSVWGSKHVWGNEPYGEEINKNLFADTSYNTDMVLTWGGDPFVHMWKVPGGQSYVLMSRFWRELGINRISIQPNLNHTSGTSCEKWIPVLPNTDGALSLAIAYTWISEGTYDQDYLDTHSVGFDEFKAYVMGDEDGIPKTPAWASEWCGVPEWTIKALAREWASKVTSIWHIHGGGKLMGHYSHEPMRLECCLLGMQGWGAPGKHQIMVYSLMNPSPTTSIRVPLGGKSRTSQGPEAEALRALGLVAEPNVPANPNSPTLNSQMLKEAFYGEYHEYYQGKGNRTNQFPPNKLYYPMEGNSVIHGYWCDRPTLFNCCVGAADQYAALQSPNLEFMVGQGIWAENATLCSDIILPINTQYEEDDLCSTKGPYTTLHPEPRCIEPIGETKTDLEAVLEVAKKWGYYEDIMAGRTFDDWLKWGFDRCGAQDEITWEELNEKGYYVAQDKAGWQEAKPLSYAFWQDPGANPLSTPSGLLEFESQGLKEHFPDDKERPPVPNWVIGGPPEEGWTRDESLFGPTAEKYPLQYSNDVPRWRYHSEHDDIPWTREIFKTVGFDGYWYETFWINPADAAARGIVEGDICKVYNDRCTILAGAHVTEKQIARGATSEHGARVDWIIPGQVDRGGSTNLLTPSGFVSMNAAGQLLQNVAVEIEKVTGEQWDEWRKNYPEAFKRPYDPASGALKFEAILEEGGLW